MRSASPWIVTGSPHGAYDALPFIAPLESFLRDTAAILLEALLKAGEKSGERLWQLPLWDDYDQQIKSDVADVKNTGGRPAGSVPRHAGSSPGRPPAGNCAVYRCRSLRWR